MPPHMPHMVPIIGPLPDPSAEGVHALEKKFKVMEVHNTPSLNVMGMCLVPRLIIPQKFKVPNFDK